MSRIVNFSILCTGTGIREFVLILLYYCKVRCVLLLLGFETVTQEPQPPLSYTPILFYGKLFIYIMIIHYTVLHVLPISVYFKSLEL